MLSDSELPEGEILYRLKMTHADRVTPYDELASEYVVIDGGRDCPSGLIIYGMFSGYWQANPSARPVVKILLAEVNRLKGLLAETIDPLEELQSRRSLTVCRVCGDETQVIVNIKFEAVPVCDRCCLAITKQTVATLVVFHPADSQGNTEIRSRYDR